MTTASERTRAMVWAGGFLIDLAQDKRLPLEVRRRAVVIARHYPTIEQVSGMAMFRHQPSGLGLELTDPFEDRGWAEQCRSGPLRYTTRLAWPEAQKPDDARENFGKV